MTRGRPEPAWRLVFTLTAAAACLLATSCTVGPDYRRPDVDLPETWASVSQPPSTAPSTQALDAGLSEWWKGFNDPTLDALVARAVESNLDLLRATARVRQARAALQGTRAGLWPTVDLSGSYRRNGANIRAEDDDGSDRSTGGARGVYQAGFDAAWEIDVFGGVRRSVEAARADLQSVVEDRRNVLVTLISEVALAYMELRRFQRELAIARENLGSQRNSAALTRRRFEAGLVSGLDTANAEVQVASTESQIPLIQRDIRQVIFALDVLLGGHPGSLAEELSAEAPIPLAPPDVPLGLPSDLLMRRPDVRRAEADLHAATARIGVATADLFPRFALTGSLGVSAERWQGLGNWGNRSWSFGPSASWPLFDAGRIRANIAVQNAAQEQALLAYRATVLLALQEVENSLVDYASERDRRVALVKAVESSRRSVELSTQLYTRGETDFLNVLSAQRALFSSEEALAVSDRNMSAAVIALYKALGGGW